MRHRFIINHSEFELATNDLTWPVELTVTPHRCGSATLGVCANNCANTSRALDPTTTSSGYVPLLINAVEVQNPVAPRHSRFLPTSLHTVIFIWPRQTGYARSVLATSSWLVAAGLSATAVAAFLCHVDNEKTVYSARNDVSIARSPRPNHDVEQEDPVFDCYPPGKSIPNRIRHRSAATARVWLCILARLEALKGLLDIKKYHPNIFARCVVVMYTQRPQLSRKR